jgi:hypothetical protein
MSMLMIAPVRLGAGHSFDEGEGLSFGEGTNQSRDHFFEFGRIIVYRRCRGPPIIGYG